MNNITICGDYNYPPFEFIDENGVPSGFNVDVSKSIAKVMGFNVKFELMEWTKAIEALRNGDYDVIQGMSISDIREKSFRFSTEYLTVVHSVFTLKEREDIVSLDDLYTQRIAVQENDISFDIITKRANEKKPIHIVLMQSQEEALEQLFLNKVDAIGGNRLTIMYYLEKTNRLDQIKTIGEPINITKFGIGMKKDRKNLVDLFNTGIEKIKKNGEYKQIYDKWFGQQINHINHQIIQHVGNGVICINNLGNITAINNSACVLLDVNREDKLFKSFYEAKLIHIIDNNIIENILYGEEKNAIFKEITYEVQGIKKILNLNITPLLDSVNNAKGIIISFKDATYEKRLIEALITKDKMQSLGRLISNVAHEIRNPFTSIKNFINLIPENIDDEEFRNSLLIHVPKQIDAIDSILKELLEYSSPKPAIASLIDLKGFINSIIKIVKTDKNINIIEDIEQDVVLKVDEKHLRQIIINILLNSIDSIEKEGEIHIYTNEFNERCNIIIRDNGKGISEDDLNRIFDPFFTTKDTGTGLGLYITYQLIRENNGHINIENTNRGTKVIVSFPLP